MRKNFFENQTERTYAEIDLSALEHNYRVLSAALPRPLMAVVKADAYGHGAVPVARRLESLGVVYLAVASAAEALELRDGGIAAPVLVLGAVGPQRAVELARRNVTLTLTDLPHAQALSEAACANGLTLTVHGKLDTGMSRLGFLDSDELLAALALPGLRAEGIFTHFATSDEAGSAFVEAQTRRFNAALGHLTQKGFNFPFIHCQNSGGMLYYNEALSALCPSLTLARAGIALYGYAPSGQDAGVLRPVMTLKARVAQVKTIPEGAVVSYGAHFTAPKDMRVAVLACGYADGYARSLSGKAYVTLHGVSCPVLGNVCMDMLMVDCSEAPACAAGDSAVLFGSGGPSLWSLARIAGTIGYELLCAVSARVPRLYLE